MSASRSDVPGPRHPWKPLLLAYLSFAVGGAVARLGVAGRLDFAALYALSAAAMAVFLARLPGLLRQRPAGQVLGWVAIPVLALAAAAHLLEAIVVFSHAGRAIADAEAALGGAGRAAGFLGSVAVILGTLMLCLSLWRAKLAPGWSVPLLLLVVPADALLPHGPPLQIARSLVVTAVAVVVAGSIARTGSAARRSPALPFLDGS